jgi:hypothetical protein
MLFLILTLILLILVSIAAILSLFCCIFAFILSICIFNLITVSLYFLLISLMLLYYMYADFSCYSLFRYSYLYLLFCCCSFSISILLLFVFVFVLLFDGINFDILVLLFYDDTLVLLFCDLLLLFLYIFDILSNNLLLLSYTINFLFTNTSYMIATTFCIYNTCCTQLSYVIDSTPNTLIIAGALTVYIKFFIVFKSSTF